MKKIIKISIICLAIASGILLLAPAIQHVSALDLAGGASAANPNTTTKDLPAIFGTIVNVILYILGAVSVIMLIYGGIRYTTSGGNATNVTAAKNTIMYAIVGLVIAILAYSIVNFVITSIK